MYYLWKPKIDGSMFVPLAYVEWKAFGTAVQQNGGSPPWSRLSSGPTTADFHPSFDTDSSHGYPTWTQLAREQSAGAQMNEGDEEEDQ